MPITPNNPFKGRHYPGEVIVLCVRWYLRYPLAYEHVAEILAERGVEVDASCIWRWVQAYAPELNKRCRPHLKPTNKSYRIDETYIKVKGEDKYLYRAVDPWGRRSTSCSRPNEMPQPPNGSCVKLWEHPAIRCHAS
jgi:IS6 family transposase